MLGKQKSSPTRKKKTSPTKSSPTRHHELRVKDSPQGSPQNRRASTIRLRRKSTAKRPRHTKSNVHLSNYEKMKVALADR